MANNESLVLFAKDFFGDSVDATLTFYSGGNVAYKTKFEEGYVAIQIPQQLKPGVYDVVASRETGEYRINNLMVAMASHYFRHARLHADINISGESFRPGEVIEDYKFNPLLREYITQLPDNAKDIFDTLAQNTGNPDSLRWGGLMTLTDKLHIGRGEAVVGGKWYEWLDWSLDIPTEIGVYNVGFHNDDIAITTEPVEYKMGTLTVDSFDWVRLVSDATYHPIYRDSRALFFRCFHEDSTTINIDMTTEDAIFGAVRNGKIFGTARSTVPATSVRLKKIGNGPVFSTDRLYVYATTTHFLLWDNRTLLAALPRWEESNVKLDWSKGVVFSSWGVDGQSRWTSNRPYGPVYPVFRTGPEPVEREEPLRNVIAGFGKIVANIPAEWTSTVTPGATLEWNDEALGS